jgi:enoyl-[acyl-carrier protein] reductase I
VNFEIVSRENFSSEGDASMTELTETEAYFEKVKENVAGPFGPLAGKKALVLGIANDQSIAYGCALAFRAFGADVSITYLNEKSKKYTERLAKHLGVPDSLYLPCDVREPGQLEAVFAAIEREWGHLDVALHSIAFAPREDLHGRVVDCSKDGFLMAMDVSCHSFIRMAKLAEPLMKDGGALITMSYFGAERVVEHYNLMGPVKAALQTAAIYLAAELGPKGIRVHPISPGPIKTRAASGIDRFDELMQMAAEKAPARALCTIEDVGMATAFLATDYAKLVTGDVMYIDGGYHIVG